MINILRTDRWIHPIFDETLAENKAVALDIMPLLKADKTKAPQLELADIYLVPSTRTDIPERWQVTLVGLDVFDPVTMEVQHEKGDDVPAWFLDADYNERCFHVSQAFFPRTGAWESIRKALKGDYDEGVWDHLAGVTSAPFEAGQERKIAVKVIDYRGNELLVVRSLDEPK